MTSSQPQLHSSRTFSLLHLLVLFSGFAGLGYQLIWSRMLAVSLGHEYVAVLAVITAFFCGLALGGFLLNKAIVTTPLPRQWYLRLELLIASWALLLVVVIPWFNAHFVTLIGRNPSELWHWLVAFLGSLLLLLPSTFAMGATLPAMQRIFVLNYRREDRVPMLYSLNTAGALLGTVLTSYYLVPSFGLSYSLLLFASINLLCAFVIWRVSIPEPEVAAVDLPANEQRKPTLHLNRLSVTLFVTGVLGIGFEILVVRLLSQVLENTVYSFTSVLAAYLLSTAIGAALYHRYARRATISAKTLESLLVLLVVSCCLSFLLMSQLDDVYRSLLPWLKAGWTVALFTELSLSLLLLLLPCMAMGALLSHLAQAASQTLGLAKALALNALGSAIAPVVYAIALIPWLGLGGSAILTVFVYLLLLRPRVIPTRFSLAAVLLLMATALIVSQLRVIDLQNGDRLLSYEDGVIAALAVVEDGAGNRHLKVNNHFTMGGTGSRYSDHRQSHLPLLFHGSPKSALYLGLGTGVTFEAAQYYPNMQSTAVELLPEAIDLMPQFGVDINAWQHQPHVLAADARRFVESDKHQYDVVLAEIFHPSRDGAGALYTVEHFRAIRARLSEDGVFCQWLPLFQLNIDTLKIITRTFLEVFPYAQLHLGHHSLQQPILCLLGSLQPLRFESEWLLDRVKNDTLQQELIKIGLNTDLALFGGFMADSDALSLFSANAEINTDNWPVVNYQAPRFVYESQNTAAERLLQLLKELPPASAASLFTNNADAALADRQQAYWRARDIYLDAGTRLALDVSIDTVVQRLQTPLLQAVKISEDFVPAYRSLIGLAEELADHNPKAAFELLQAVYKANPKQTAAKALAMKLYRAHQQ